MNYGGPHGDAGETEPTCPAIPELRRAGTSFGYNFYEGIAGGTGRVFAVVYKSSEGEIDKAARGRLYLRPLDF